MTNEELVGLIQSGVEVETNMFILYQQNTKFIRKLALPYSKACDIDDLMQEAYFGLDKAVKGYNPKQEFMFITYMECRIRGQLQRYYQNCGRTKRIPSHILTLISKRQKFLEDYRLQHDCDPSEDIIMQELQISQKQLDMVAKCTHEMNCQSLDDPVPGADNLTIGDAIADDYDLEGDVTERIATEQNNAVLWQTVDELDDRHRAVVKCRYKRNMSLSDIGRLESVSVERVRQIESKAFTILRKKNKVREIASFYGYHSQRAYHGSLQRFKDSGTSSTEAIALKRLELEEQLADLEKMMVGL